MSYGLSSSKIMGLFLLLTNIDEVPYGTMYVHGRIISGAMDTGMGSPMSHVYFFASALFGRVHESTCTQ